MKHSVPVVLQHLCVGVEAGIAKVDNLLCKELDAVCRIAENDRLVDLKTREECIEAMNLLAFINIAVILCYAS